jgi:hypothetical protein
MRKDYRIGGSTDPLSLNVNGDGYVVSNKPIIDSQFDIQLDFKISPSLDHTSGTILSISNSDKTNCLWIYYKPTYPGNLVCTITGFKDNQSKTDSVVLLLENYDRLESDKLYHLTISNDKWFWTLAIGEHESTQFTASMPAFNSKTYVYFGGNILNLDAPKDFYLTNMTVNGKLITCNDCGTDFTASGKVTTNCECFPSPSPIGPPIHPPIHPPWRPIGPPIHPPIHPPWRPIGPPIHPPWRPIGPPIHPPWRPIGPPIHPPIHPPWRPIGPPMNPSGHNWIYITGAVILLGFLLVYWLKTDVVKTRNRSL